MHYAFQRILKRVGSARACMMRSLLDTGRTEFTRALLRPLALVVVIGVSAPGPVAAAGDTRLPWEEYDKLIKTRATIGAMGPDLFGDKIDLYTTSLSFSLTDISLPGNNALPVALTRTFTVFSKSPEHPNDLPMGDWDLDLPRLSGVFATTWHDQRCSGNAQPPVVYSQTGKDYAPLHYWHGNQAHMPNGGEMLLADQGAQQPTTGGPYPWMTAGFTYFSCLASIGNGSGEGFLGVGPDGTRYWFNWMAQYYEPKAEKPGDTTGVTRKRNVLYATRVEDRFGNWVTYSYSNGPTSPARLSSIAASDGRSITLTYNAQGQVATASDGSHTWNYQYANSSLSGVVLPDGRSWLIDFQPLDTEIEYEPDGERDCSRTAFAIGGGGTGHITHPSGAVGEFEVGPSYQGRSNVPMACDNWEFPTNNPLNDVAVWPRRFDIMGIRRKRVTGPGLEAMEWTYSSGDPGSWAEGTGPTCQTQDCADPVCVSDDCAGTISTTVSGPGNRWIRYTFGNSYRYNEGKLLKVEQGTGPTSILRTETMTYELAQSAQAFPTPIGTSPQSRGDGFTSEYPRPQRSKVIAQDSATLTSTVNTFDNFVRPLSVTKVSSLGHTRTDVTTYHDNLSKWVLGQVAQVVNTNTTPNVVLSKTEYDPVTAMPLRTYGPGTTQAAGKLQQTLTYNVDGTVATVSDARDGVGGVDTTIVLSNWKRGIPQSIQYPPTTESPGGATESAVVNNDGTLASVTDENGNKTCYSYDAMGRLASITYPSESSPGVCDTTAWAMTTQTFAPVAAVEYGIPAGHWKQTISTGNARKMIYFDAFWRPLVEEAYDNTNPSSTRSLVVKRYDVNNRLAFQSYPLNSLSSYASTLLTGTRTFYDALDRVFQVDQDSELGVLTTITEYLPGFLRRTTNPRNIATTETFQAFDSPSYDAPVQIDAGGNSPDQVRTIITRDSLGKPMDLSRGPGG